MVSYWSSFSSFHSFACLHIHQKCRYFGDSTCLHEMLKKLPTPRSASCKLLMMYTPIITLSLWSLLLLNPIVITWKIVLVNLFLFSGLTQRDCGRKRYLYPQLLSGADYGIFKNLRRTYYRCFQKYCHRGHSCSFDKTLSQYFSSEFVFCVDGFLYKALAMYNLTIYLNMFTRTSNPKFEY